jgi:hypothetical protein
MLRRYAGRRDRLCPVPRSDRFFLTRAGTPLSPGQLQDAFARLLVHAGISVPAGQRAPRMHDLRHVLRRGDNPRWDGSETALREAKASLNGAGPGTGPMLRSQSPDLVRQELTAWAAATEMTRGVTRDAALAAAPARKGRRAGQPVRPREISCARTRRAVITAIRAGRACYEALTREIAKYRTVIDRNRHRARKSKSPSNFSHATAKGTVTRIAPAVITMANSPA